MPYKDKEKLKVYAKEYRETHKEQRIATLKKYYNNNKDKCLQCNKKWKEENKDHVRQKQKEWWLANKNRLTAERYGITLDQFQQIIFETNGFCSICEELMVFDKKCKNQACIDHDHKTGNIRGLICSRCNLLLGKVGDSVDILSNAIKYLQKHQNIV